jgi:hypothetical protein
MPLLIFFLVILFSAPVIGQALHESTDQVWEVNDRRWTVEEEYRFAKWVDETITEDFFIHHKIPTDCADAVYAIRWIYARIRQLPAAATTKDGKWIGHWSTDWKHFPTDPEWHKDERFKAILLYLFSQTWTGTLPLDTYPILISPDSVTPGTVFFMAESHAGLIAHISLDGSQAHPLQTWESMLPVKIQKLSLKNFYSPRPDSSIQSGLVRFRWPVFENGEWTYLPVKEHPFYSEEQYGSDFDKGYVDFTEAVAKRIDPTEYAPIEKMVKVMETITRFLKERVPLVLVGYQQCRKGGCPEGSDLKEIHMTSGRDEMILLLMDHLSEIVALNHLNKEMAIKRMKAIPIDISKKRSITFYDVYQNYLWLSTRPEDSIEARWGLKKCEMIRAQILTTKNSITFIEKTYRKRDANYADFSIRQQQHLLLRLEDELLKSACKKRTLPPKKKAKQDGKKKS